MNHSLWPIALVGGMVCAYLPVGSADPVFTTESTTVAERSAMPVVRGPTSAERGAMPVPSVLVAAAEADKASGTTTTTTTTTSTHLPTGEEVRAAAERGAAKAVAAGKRAGAAVKQEWQRFEHEHPEATRPTTTTITTGDPKTPLVIHQHAASQP